MRLPFALLAMMGFVLSTVFGSLPITRTGLQCPTAPQQMVARRDCCGRLVVRAPHSGEKDFVQCRCAERKAGVQKATVATKVVLFFDAALAFEIAVVRPPSRVIPSNAASFRSTGIPPFVRPPASA